MSIWSLSHAVGISRPTTLLILTSHRVPDSPSPRRMNRFERQRLPRALRCLPKLNCLGGPPLLAVADFGVAGGGGGGEKQGHGPGGGNRGGGPGGGGGGGGA